MELGYNNRFFYEILKDYSYAYLTKQFSTKRFINYHYSTFSLLRINVKWQKYLLQVLLVSLVVI